MAPYIFLITFPLLIGKMILGCFRAAPITTTIFTVISLAVMAYKAEYSKPADTTTLRVSAQTMNGPVDVAYAAGNNKRSYLIRIENTSTRTIDLSRVFLGCEITRMGNNGQTIFEKVVFRPSGGVEVGPDWRSPPMLDREDVSVGSGKRMMAAVDVVGSFLGGSSNTRFGRCFGAATTAEVWGAFGLADQGLSNYRG